jgi:hypothetical protein
MKPFDLERALAGEPVMFKYNDKYKEGKIVKEIIK